MTRCRAIVGQKQPEPPGGQQQPWSSKRRVPRMDHSGTRTMGIPAMGSRTSHVKRGAPVSRERSGPEHGVRATPPARGTTDQGAFRPHPEPPYPLAVACRVPGTHHLRAPALLPRPHTLHVPHPHPLPTRLHHKQVYTYHMHQGKLALILAENQHAVFSPIATYLTEMATTCPHELFQESTAPHKLPMPLTSPVSRSWRGRTLRHALRTSPCKRSRTTSAGMTNSNASCSPPILSLWLWKCHLPHEIRRCAHAA